MSSCNTEVRCETCGDVIKRSDFITVPYEERIVFFCGANCADTWEGSECKICLDYGEVVACGGFGPITGTEDGMSPCPECHDYYD